MTKRQKIIRNLIILILLFLVISSITGASLTPLMAHRRSERSGHYGPSRIIASQRINGIVLYLCKYDKWYSLDTIRRGFLWLWYPGDHYFRKKPDINTPIDFDFGYTSTTDNNNLGRFYGIVNDPDIKSVKLEVKLTNGQMKTFEQRKLYDNMFLFILDQGTIGYKSVKITGFDRGSNIIYEKTFPE